MDDQRGLTLKVLAEYARILGATCRKDSFGDIIVAYGKGDARQTYHTNDKMDALGTMRCMLGGHESFAFAEGVHKHLDSRPGGATRMG